MRDATHYAAAVGTDWPAERLAEIVPLMHAQPDVFVHPGTGTAGPPLEVVANHGRWVVSCPCGGAQLAHPSDPRFLCVDCGNADNGGKYRPVTWPKKHEQIRALLDARADRALRNWLPGETVADLRAENLILEEGTP